MSAIQVHDEVTESLRRGGAVVALESAVVTHGLPREPLGRSPRYDVGPWNSTGPVNLETARAVQRAVRAAGAVPATIAIIEGVLRIGLSDDELRELAGDCDAMKASTRDLAFAVATGATAGTTVSATLHACAVCPDGPIRVMATGGIGGVHRDWSILPDVSTDLVQLARSQVCVVCSGFKSILDLAATGQAIETLSIPILGYRTDVLPRFYCQGTADPSVPGTRRVDDAGAIADLCRAHWQDLAAKSAVIVANPVPADVAMTTHDVERAVAQAERQAASAGISGAARTPFLLAAIAQLTGGRSLDANIALLVNNAALAAEVAVAMARR